MPSRTTAFLTLLARIWFPVVLIGLLVLAVPGLVLFIFHVCGKQGEVNDWLVKTTQVSYHMPLPWAASLFLLLLPLAILLLYFLKLKRKPLSVPSTFLWRKSIEDLHVNSFFQWLRDNVLLLLQLLTVVALIYAVMAFHLHGRTTEGAHYILMIDNSASMNATDVSPNRLDRAKQEALKEIDSRTDRDFGMVIEFNSSAEIKQSYTSDRALLRAAVRNISPTQKPTRIEEALSLADSLANPLRSTEDVSARPANVEPGKERTVVAPKGIVTDLHLFSDGRFPDLSETVLANLNSRVLGNESPLGNLNLHFHMAGKPGRENVNNVALTTINALRNDRNPTNLIMHVGAMNFRSVDVPAKVQLERVVNGELKGIYEQPLFLPQWKPSQQDAGSTEGTGRDTPEERYVDFDLSDVDDRAAVVFHAQFVKIGDDLPLDDEAWLVVGLVRKAQVLIVGKSNEVLDKFFFHNPATQEIADVKQVAPDYLQKDDYRKDARNGTYDLIIFDRCAPPDENTMPRSNTFCIGIAPPPLKMTDVEKLENPHIQGWMHEHPVLRYLVGLQDVLLSEAFKVKDLPEHTPRLIETDRDATVLFTLGRGPFTDLVMTFPLIDDKDEYVTNWPLRPSFPIFLQNVLYVLGNVTDAASEATVQPGQVKTLRPDSSANQVTVISPGGVQTVLERDHHSMRTDFSFSGTDTLGVYQARFPDGGRRSFAVNLLDPQESNIEPRPVVQIGHDSFATGQEHGQPRELWSWFALAAVMLLVVEWVLYNRRIYI